MKQYIQYAQCWVLRRRLRCTVNRTHDKQMATTAGFTFYGMPASGSVWKQGASPISEGIGITYKVSFAYLTKTNLNVDWYSHINIKDSRQCLLCLCTLNAGTEICTF